MNGDNISGGAGDPTKNVLDKVEDAVKRLDDLRSAAEKFTEASLAHLKEIADLRAKHQEQLNEAETKRIDAIRSVDVGAAAITAERVATSATVLADQQTKSAEALRGLVSTTAAALSTATAGTVQQLTDRIAVLEKGSYEGSGKSAVVDPMMTRMLQTLEALQRNMAQSEGGDNRRDNSRSNVGMIVGIVAALFAFAMLTVTIIDKLG